MHLFDFVILTDDHFVKPASDWQSENALEEDRLVQEALELKGFTVTRKSWADPDFDWRQTKAAIFRTTWDYFHRFDEWKTWLGQVTSKTRLINSIELAQWNMDKHYLRDLYARGINVPETRYVETGEQTTLEDLQAETGWKEAILKPCVAGAARHTYRLDLEQPGALEHIFQQLISKEAMMLQPFQHNILSQGEISLMVMGGTCTHAVIKKAKPGDFRVQDDFGGSVAVYKPNQEEMDFAEKAVAACKTLPAYARVDIIRDNQGALALIEMELIEPELWFRLYPQAADVLAEFLSKKS